MRNVFVLAIALCSGCASNPSSESIKVQSNGKTWNAIPVHIPRGEEGVIIAPDRNWPMFAEGEVGTTTWADGRAAAEDYVVQEKLPCRVVELGKELSQGGWVVKLTCTSTASRKE